MGYIFRLHKTGSTNYKDWDKSRKIDSNDLKSITDVVEKGGVQSKMATSIPTPFARMHLFETAFELIGQDHPGTKNYIYHKLVSDCLDVFQLLFTQGNDSKITYKKWSRQQEITNLKGDGIASHTLLAKSLDLFFQSDRFRNTSEIYMIYYNNILLGGTSPLTVFFTSPNWERNMTQNGWILASTTEDIYFDNLPYHLYKRDIDFQKFMQKFRIAYKAELGQFAPHLYDYLLNSFQFNNEIRDFIANQALEANYTKEMFQAEFDSIPADREGGTNEKLYSGAIPIMKVKHADLLKQIEITSGFIMKPSVERFRVQYDSKGREIEIKTPLALVPGNHKIMYIKSEWDSSIPVPDVPQVPLYERMLPGDAGIRYPYVSTGDFLEDSIIEMPFDLNRERFLTGYTGNFKFLLPVKKEYFKFFTIEDLRKNLQIKQNRDDLIVTLKIPLKDGKFVEFSKKYLRSDPAQVIRNEIGKGFGLGFFPFYKVLDKTELNEYSVMMVENLSRDKSLEIRFFNFNQLAKDTELNAEITERTPLSVYNVSSKYFHIKGNADNAFDLIEIRFDGVFKGIILPLMKELEVNRAARKFFFAVDFGTSNTHIAYSTNDDPTIRGFGINMEDQQMILLNARDTASNILPSKSFDTGFGTFEWVNGIKNREFVPAVIGTDDNAIKYPARTSTFESNDFVNSGPNLFRNVNIGYAIDREESLLRNSRYATNIKWGMEEKPSMRESQDRVEAYFHQTLWMIKNKIMLNDGKADAEICWFAPVSMSTRTSNNFAQLWDKCLKAVFGNNHNISLKRETESVVPYFALKQRYGMLSSLNALNVDIGGGTTDMLFFLKDLQKFYSVSMKFAGGDLWGDGLAYDDGASKPKDNGFIQVMKDKINRNEVIFTDPLVRNYYETFISNALFGSEDVSSFMFKYDKDFRFSATIANHKTLSTLLYIHYSAILYHISQIIQMLGIDMPVYLTFTGKGSEYIKLMSSNQDDITKLTQKLFEKFSGKKCNAQFKVILAENPKELTAEGGVLKMRATAGDATISPEKIIHYGFAESAEFPELKLGNYRQAPYQVKHLEQLEPAVLKNFTNFIDLLFSDREIIMAFKDYNINLRELGPEIRDFIIDSAKTSFTQLKYDLRNVRCVNEEEEFGETLFFWTLKDTLYQLSKKLVNI